MAITIITTPGSPSANSYASVADADAYFADSPYASVWTAAEPAAKAWALVTATRLLDQYVEWYGSTATSSQRLLWPRYRVWALSEREYLSSTTIPEFLVYAVAEFAQQLLVSNRTADQTSTSSAALKRLKVDVIELEWDNAQTTVTVDVLPDAVLALILPFGELRRLHQGGAYTVPLVRS